MEKVEPGREMSTVCLTDPFLQTRLRRLSLYESKHSFDCAAHGNKVFSPK